MTTTHRHELRAALSLSTDGLLLPDGTLWSHACTVGKYNKGEEFQLERPAIENFVRVFNSGYPNKVPVDYEHASTSNDPEVRKLRAQGEVPKAGDVKELVGVFSAADFTGELLATAQRLADKVGRPLDDPQNLGLWMRWKPTPKALEKIRAEEFSELSITFDDDYPDKVSGKGQGPTILAVALTMMPFLDQMLPVAASRGGRREYDPGASDAPDITNQPEGDMTRTITMLAAVTALAAKPVTTEEEAITELTALQSDVSRLRKLSAVVAEKFGGESDPDKIGTKITELTAKVDASEKAAADATAAQIKTVVEQTLKEHEDRIVPAMATVLSRELTRELESGKPVKETETYKALTAMPKHGITARSLGVDDGSSSASTSDDVKLDAKAKELMGTDPTLKALAERSGFGAAFPRALSMAAGVLGIAEKQKSA